MTALSTDSIIGVIGAGTMGAGIAQVAAQAGHVVRLFDAQAGAASAGIDAINKQLVGRVDKGKLDDADRQSFMARLSAANEMVELADCGLVIEAIVEDLSIKQKVFAELEEICSEQTLLATNTSSLSITAVASRLARPSNFLGLHFFNPAPVLKLVEVIPGLATAESVVQTGMDTMLAWKKKPVRARNTPGFIVNRVARPFYAETFNLLEQQAASPATLDALIRDCGGFRMGACQLTDLIGHDVNAKVTRTVFDAFDGDPRFRPSLVQQELVDAGRYGRKSGQGFFSYADSAAADQPAAADDAAPPTTVELFTEGLLSALAERLKASGVAVTQSRGDEYLQVDGCAVAISDGRLATERAVSESQPNLVLFDLALDYGAAGRIGLAAADSCSDEARQAAAGLFQAAGMTVSWLDDVPGLLVLRTVVMLANEAASAVNEGIGSAAGVDDAMCFGVNYPIGPLAWADRINPRFVLRVLENLQAAYGDDRYRASPRLRRVAATNAGFHDRIE